MSEQFEVMRYIVMQFNTDLDGLIQESGSLGLKDARRVVKSMRQYSPEKEFYIIAVLDE